MKPSQWKGGSTAPLQQGAGRFFSDDEALLQRWESEDVSLPAVNVRETPESWEMDVAAPGFEKGDFTVHVGDGLLTIRAERKSSLAPKEEEKNFIRKEFSYSRFERCFSLPAGVREEDIKASFENGILLLVLPRTAAEVQRASRQIPIG